MAFVAVTYWINGKPAQVVGLWEGMPKEGVLWVDVNNHRMQGMDNYWVHGNFYGGFSDPENDYGGFRKSRWRIDPFERAKRQLPPHTAHVIRGVMLSDDDARELGLI